MSEKHFAEDLTEYRISLVEQTLKSINDNLAQLATLEQKHFETRDALARAFKHLEDQDERLRSLETEMPLLKMVRSWVITGVVGIVALLGTSLINLLHSIPKQ